MIPLFIREHSEAIAAVPLGAAALSVANLNAVLTTISLSIGIVLGLLGVIGWIRHNLKNPKGN